MRPAQMWSGVMLLVLCAACGSGRQSNAYSPTAEFVDQLKVKADSLAKSELARFNALETASKNEIRYEEADNPLTPGGAIYFKEYRDYTSCKVQDISMSKSYINPIIMRLVFNYHLMTTPVRHTDFPDSPQKVQTDTEYKVYREDSITIDYRCTPVGELTDPLPGLMPRDSLVNPFWNKPDYSGLAFYSPPNPPIPSPVKAPPAVPPAPQSARQQTPPPQEP